MADATAGSVAGPKSDSTSFRDRAHGRAATVWDALSRRPVLSAFVVALFARVAVALLAAPLLSGSVVLDDATYHQMAVAKAAGATASWDEYTFQLYDQTATLLRPLTLLYRLVGPSAIAGRLFMALLGAGAVACLTRLALEVTVPKWALLAGMLAALWPSSVLWSSLILKDAAVWLMLTALALIVALAGRESGRRLVLAGVAAATLLFLLGHLRMNSVLMGAWAMALATWIGPRPGRLLRGIGATIIAILIPWYVGLGPAGLTFVANAGSLDLERRTNAVGSVSAIVEPLKPAGPGEPEVEPEGGGVGADIRHLPRGLEAMLLEPLPWRVGGSTSLQFARAESPLWYLLLVLALLGLPEVWQNRRVLAFPLLAGVGTLVVYALTEGNIGTAFRHRGEFAWAVVLLAGLGARRVALWKAAKDRPEAAS